MYIFFNKQTRKYILVNTLFILFQWVDNESLFPDKNGDPGRILHAIKSSPIALVDNAPKGTQLKLLLILEVI